MSKERPSAARSASARPPSARPPAPRRGRGQRAQRRASPGAARAGCRRTHPAQRHHRRRRRRQTGATVAIAARRSTCWSGSPSPVTGRSALALDRRQPAGRPCSCTSDALPPQPRPTRIPMSDLPPAAARRRHHRGPSRPARPGRRRLRARYGDPVAAARRWQDAGAEWLHLVDLDAAFGRGTNRELQAEIVGALDIQVEMSGGIRDDESLGRGPGHRLPPGQHRHRRPRAARVVRQGHRRARRPDRHRPRRARPHPRGPRLDPEGGDLYETLARLDAEGCARYVVTDVNKDGMLQGPNLRAAARRLRRHRPPRHRLRRRHRRWPTSRR